MKSIVFLVIFSIPVVTTSYSQGSTPAKKVTSVGFTIPKEMNVGDSIIVKNGDAISNIIILSDEMKRQNSISLNPAIYNLGTYLFSFFAKGELVETMTFINEEKPKNNAKVLSESNDKVTLGFNASTNMFFIETKKTIRLGQELKLFNESKKLISSVRIDAAMVGDNKYTIELPVAKEGKFYLSLGNQVSGTFSFN